MFSISTSSYLYEVYLQLYSPSDLIICATKDYIVHSTYTNNCNNNVQFLNKNILDFRLFKSQLACFKFYLRDAEDDLEKLGAGTEEKSAELYFSLFTHCVETELV